MKNILDIPIQLVSKENPIKPFTVISNDLVEASHKLTSLEQHIIIYAISALKRKDKKFKQFRIKTKDLAEMLNLSTASSNQIIKATFILAKKVVVFKNKERTTILPWFSYISYSTETKTFLRGFVEFALNPELAPYLLEVTTKFLKIENKYLFALKGTYSIQILMWLRKWWNTSKYDIKIHKISIEKFRRMLALEDYLDYKDLYPRFNDFKTYVLLPAIEEINDSSDIYVKFETIRFDSKVKELVFYYSEKKHYRDFKDFENMVVWFNKQEGY